MITTTNAPAPSNLGAGDACDRDWLLTAGGASLLLLALSKRSTIGLAALLGGGYLLYRSYANGSLAGVLPDSVRLPDALGALGCRNSSAPLAQSRKEWHPPEDADFVDEASMDSFPGSDPPASY
jgi:hypothetical protein